MKHKIPRSPCGNTNFGVNVLFWLLIPEFLLKNGAYHLTFDFCIYDARVVKNGFLLQRCGVFIIKQKDKDWAGIIVEHIIVSLIFFAFFVTFIIFFRIIWC